MMEPDRRVYLSVYFLSFLLDGFFWILPGAIFVETQRKLGLSTGVMAFVVMSGSIGYTVSCGVSGYILDHYSEAHRWQSLISFMASIFVTLLMFTDNIILAVIAFTIIGFAAGVHDSYVYVFPLRLYPESNANANIFFVALLLTISAILLPLMLQLSIFLTNTHIYPIIAFAVIALIESIGLVLLKTPIHDELRTLKRKITREISKNTIVSVSHSPRSPVTPVTPSSPISMSSEECNAPTSEQFEELCRATSERMEDTSNYKMKQNALISLFLWLMCFHGMMESVFLTFTTTYCIEYLELNEKYGRYLLSIYIGSALFYRVIKALFFRNMNPIYNMTIGFYIRCIVAVLLPFYGSRFLVLVVLYFFSGWSASSAWPGCCACSESVRPMTGFVSCLIVVVYGIGGIVGISIVGELIDIYSAKVFQFVLIAPALMAVLTTTIALVMVKRYKKNRTDIVRSIDLAELRFEDENKDKLSQMKQIES